MNTTRKRPKHKIRLQTLWTGPPLSRLERAALQSFVNVGYTVHVYTYNPLREFTQQLPKSATSHIHVHDAREILPESDLFEYSGRAKVGKRADAFSFLPFSDLFRFTMLHKNGGAWIDLDIFLVKPIPPTLLARPYVFSTERTVQSGAYKNPKPKVIDIGFIKVPAPHSPLTTWLLERIPRNLKGPFDYMNLFRRGLQALELEKYAISPMAFLPLNWWDVSDAFGAESGHTGVCYRGKYGTAPFCVNDLKKNNVYGIHWFRAILRKKGLPYERHENRETDDNLYETMVAQIEKNAGIAKNTL